MAEWVLQQYTISIRTESDMDPFASLAQQISVCSATRAEGGKIGWVECDDDKAASYDEAVLPMSVKQQIFQKQPKAGDMFILPSATQWHIVQVVELWTELPPMVEEDVESNQDVDYANDTHAVQAVGSHSGRNVIRKRKKLKGHGVLPKVDLEHLKSYHIQTTGCQMNVADSERLEGILQNEMNLLPATSPKEADLILFNTCSIRDHAEQKLYDALGPFAAQKRKQGDQHRNKALVVTGCVAQQEGEALIRRVPEIDVVLGPQYVPHLKNVLEKVAQGSQIVVTQPMFLQNQAGSSSSDDDNPTTTFPNDDFHSKPVRGHNVRAWVNVIFGCNEHCTYCVVPATRGMEQSRTMEAILQECLDLASAGYKEVTLLGQNIDAYGRDMVPKRNFAELLEFLNANIPTKMRIRYVTSHPRYFSSRVIDAVANLDKVCECFHVPFQAGDDEVLKKMRRGYTFDSYMGIIDKIRAKAPDAAICGDVIVGFPGETEEAFQKTLEIMKAVKFDNLNTFAYSPRPNTEAALWEDMQVPEDVKANRLQRVQALANQHGLERSQRYLGRTVEVLVEDENPRNPKNEVMGRTRQGRQVYFPGILEDLRGDFVQVQITEARTWSLMGQMVSD